MREHFSWYWPIYLCFVVLLGAVLALGIAWNHTSRELGEQCGRVGGVTLEPEYDSEGNVAAYWCLDAAGNPLHVPEWN